MPAQARRHPAVHRLASDNYYYVVIATSPTGETMTSNEARAVVGEALHTNLNFDASSGTNAADGSGNAHAGTLGGGASWAAGKTGNAVVLDGNNGYISLPDELLGDVADFTVSAWVNWRTASSCPPATG